MNRTMEKAIGVVKRFWFIILYVIYFLTNNWLLGNFILIYIGFRIGNFWKEYKHLVIKQGKAWQKEWGLNNGDIKRV